jgi:hypothetical protein
MSWVGSVCEPLDEGVRSAGQCFAFGDAQHVVTNDHVVRAAIAHGIDPLYVTGPGLQAPVPAVADLGLPHLDLAILRIERDVSIEPFRAAGGVDVGERVDVSAWVSPGLVVAVSTRVIAVNVLAGNRASPMIQVANTPPMGPGWSGAPVHRGGRVVGVLVGGAYPLGDPRVQRPTADADDVFAVPMLDLIDAMPGAAS